MCIQNNESDSHQTSETLLQCGSFFPNPTLQPLHSFCIITKGTYPFRILVKSWGLKTPCCGTPQLLCNCWITTLHMADKSTGSIIDENNRWMFQWQVKICSIPYRLRKKRNFDATVLWKTKGTLLMISFVFNTNLRKQQSRVRLKN